MLETDNILGGEPSKKIVADIHNAGEAVSWMSNICGPHDLKVHEPSKIHFRHVGNILNSTTTAIGYIEYGTDVTVKVEDLSNSYSISLPLSGYQELSCRDGNVQSNITNGVIISPAAPYELHISGNCRKTLVRISRQAMELGLESLIGKPADKPLIFDPKMDAKVGSSSAWWRTIRYIETELGNTDSLYNSPAFIRDIEQALIKGILTSQPHNYSDDVKNALRNNLPSYLIKTIDYLKENARNEIHMDDIEWISGVSRNKLYSDFKRYIGMPPTAYLKRIRMSGVRTDIIKSMGEESISTLALNWGFNHLGRFSTDYKNIFGETPSETLAKAKLNL
ncbi:AraC family transcriptional regulator [Marinobacterium sediminicola]|uniref:AraC-type DNA-binding protein n=1 Tax=Marinobacterium sediminicola TaxID=518898 RepID=A0ABY1S3A4_9GAMM|nr:AraC family transcriptional regulator [Marinobacterium sediminicola]ULG68276.1 AraC family transcriptional regulator [Marinobacterium sediminicola]SMR77754.1 AraC-type DNA-binding protein [Marinobacterium sediminicola]